MARYHFNVHDGLGILDVDGSEFPDWATARIVAIRLAGEILKDDPKSALSCDDWHLEVTDGTGLILLRVDFALTEVSAMPVAKVPCLSVAAHS
ncbi:DUF6894 family protein [Methylobacterium komagatae]|uniref:DUF6894 family protein n=1 Tax=Methylobacterium komagatae TaxID=374425 RepID=A0ABW2BQD6_9HYPH